MDLTKRVCYLHHPTVTLRCTSCGAIYADTEPRWVCVCSGLLTVDYQWPRRSSRRTERPRLEQGRQDHRPSGATRTSCR